MKVIASVFLLCFGLFAAATEKNATDAPRLSKQKFYRAHHSGKVKHQAGGLDVVNAASFEPGVSPGGLATVFGTNLSSVTGVVSATTDPLPLSLADVRVAVNGVFAPLVSLAANSNGQDQISFQVPYGTSTGPSAAKIEIVDPSGNVIASSYVDSFTEDPGIFTYGNDYAVALHGSDGTLIGPNNRVNPGEYIVLYTTGLGPLTLTLSDGYGAPSNPLAYTLVTPDVQINGESAQIYFSGLAPGYVGLYQINLRVPDDVPPGTLDLRIVTPASTSATVGLPVN